MRPQVGDELSKSTRVLRLVPGWGRSEASSHSSAVVAEVADQAGKLAIELVDVSGNIDVVTVTVTEQAETFTRLHAAAGEIKAGNASVAGAAETVLASSAQASADVESSQVAVRDSLAAIHTLVGWVGSLAGELESTRTALADIAVIAKQVNAIAERTHVLALNARIEAARSGDAGKGFTVIADNVRQLADQSIGAASDIDKTLRALGSKLGALTEQGAEAQARAEAARGATGAIGEALDTFGVAMAAVGDQVSAIADVADRSAHQVDDFLSGMTGLVASVDSSTTELNTARSRVVTLLDSSEKLIGGIASMGLYTPDTPFIQLAQRGAAQVAAVFEQSVASGAISMVDLFDENYREIPGSNPTQYMCRWIPFTDRVLPAVQEPLLETDPDKIIWIAAVDRNGLLGTHNKRFAHPQGPDPVWNAANARTRRIFAERGPLAAARNTDAPFLLQAIRRDVGGGRFVLSKDASAPIFVNGRHWGAIRCVYNT